MWKTVLLIFASELVGLDGFGQVKKQFTVEKNEECNKVELCLKAKTGNCFIRPSQNNELLNIYSNQDVEEYSHTFSNEVKDKTCIVKLALDQESERGVGRKISHHVFGGGERPNEKFWKVYLTEDLPYSLDLHYGLGNGNLDLARLSVRKLKINTGIPDVNVSYSTGEKNKLHLSPFFIKMSISSLT